LNPPFFLSCLHFFIPCRMSPLPMNGCKYNHILSNGEIVTYFNVLVLIQLVQTWLNLMTPCMPLIKNKNVMLIRSNVWQISDLHNHILTASTVLVHIRRTTATDKTNSSWDIVGLFFFFFTSFQSDVTRF
jgi:hypothetical protein